jgi:cytochrome c biogenesis protein CcmG/thiol:disulfide interchange protein DsbE
MLPIPCRPVLAHHHVPITTLPSQWPMTNRPFAPYYRDVRSSRFLLVYLLLPLALVCACDRGAHPDQTGKVAPDFTVSDGTSTIHLANYRGQIVLLNFWATWCAPCIHEMPGLMELHRDRPDLAILAVSIDEDEDQYRRFLDTRHIDLITVRDPPERRQALPHRRMARDLHHRPQRHHSPQAGRRPRLVQPRDPRLPQQPVR